MGVSPWWAVHYHLEGVPFPSYGSSFITAGVTGIATYMLINPPYNLSLTDARLLAPAFAEGIVAGYQGDGPGLEIAVQTQTVIGYLQSQPDPMAQMFADLLLGFFSDSSPADNDLSINLVTGVVR